MEKVYNYCCGIDVHKIKIVACLRKGSKQEIREFSAESENIRHMCSWLLENECEMIALESTASYWKPLVNIFELSNLNYMVINAKEFKNVPGRKTDVMDSEWIAQLLQHGLLKASYIPNREQRELREISRLRSSLTQEKARYLNRLQKVLEGANIKLSSFVSDITGVFSSQILHALFIDDNKKVIESLIANNNRIRADKETLRKAIDGIITPMQKEIVKVLLQQIDNTENQIANLDNIIDRETEKFDELKKNLF